MTVFEQEMRKFFAESPNLSADTLFSNKVMLTPIGENLRAKVEFITTQVSDHYNALKLSIINRTEGVVDTQVFKFKDIIGMKNGQEPHIWDDHGRVGWYMFNPSLSDRESVQEEIEAYIGMYSDQEMHHGGQTMGGMLLCTACLYFWLFH